MLSALRTPKASPLGSPSQEVIQVAAWAASTAYLVGQIVVSGTTQNPGHYYQCTVAGTSGASAPAWPTNGTTVSDNSATWQDIGQGYGGDMSQGANGLARYLTGLQPLRDQVAASFAYSGLLTATKASGTTAADGQAIYYDVANAVFVTAQPANGFYAGTARGSWVSGVTTGVLNLNGLHSSGTTGTSSGAGFSQVYAGTTAAAEALFTVSGMSGATGPSCYTLGDVITALKQIGILKP